MRTNSQIKENIATTIKAYIDNTQGMNNVKFAELVGVKEGAVRFWKNGTNVPSFEYLDKICEVIGISIIELFGLEKDASLSPEELELLHLYKHDFKMNNIINRIKNNDSLKDIVNQIVNNSK